LLTGQCLLWEWRGFLWLRVGCVGRGVRALLWGLRRKNDAAVLSFRRYCHPRAIQKMRSRGRRLLFPASTCSHTFQPSGLQSSHSCLASFLACHRAVGGSSLQCRCLGGHSWCMGSWLGGRRYPLRRSISSSRSQCCRRHSRCKCPMRNRNRPRLMPPRCCKCTSRFVFGRPRRLQTVPQCSDPSPKRAMHRAGSKQVAWC